MNPSIAQIFELNDECVYLCHRLIQCLKEERRALIELKTEEIQQANLRKEGLLASLLEKKTRLKQLAYRELGVTESSEIETRLGGELREQWKLRRDQWSTAWNEMNELCLRNQRFLKHSLRNLGLLVDHLRRLCGEPSLYSNKGTRIDASVKGRVLEARF